MPADTQQRNLAPSRCMWEARDADEHAHNLTDWCQEYDQISSGAFYGRIDEVQLDEMQVFREHTSQALRQQCNVWPESLWIGIPAALACRINGRPVGEAEVMCQPGHRDFELVTPEDFTIYGLVVSRRLLASAAGEAGLALLERAPTTYMRLRLPPQTRDSVTFLIERLLQASRDPLAPQVHRDILMMALIELLQKEMPCDDVPPSYPHRKRVVDQVKRYVDDPEHAPVTVAELCELTHVSQRTLQYCFTSILGISPVQFLRTSRLNRVRRVLTQPEGTTTVTRAANDWGFYHLGQFSQDYRRLFGESPSETLGRYLGGPART
ncbi:AraC family ethanolamine operon transcriptional activator [Modicisalibacter xianhensis]|uniref:AraC family ethanolamine operon transcriptional activator n=1 Tax=Modicisalibacter xianhensis TaxID=442341 RepID=A0A4V6QAS0_9GAMM|nr:helix-turn-helix domain-containing protein [Halomonas xianhensis]TDX28154.1 AraC family ethanolamine operon transcriptional activator [Halomonas xianhensis]